MTRKINEAAITLDIVDFNSSDFETLAQILHLAGVAEHGEADASAISPELGAEPDLGTEVPSEIPSEVPAEVGTEMKPEDTDITLGIDGNPVLDITDDSDDIENPELDGFDMERMRQLSGLSESTEEPVEDEEPEEKLEESFLPDLTLGEDATEEREVEYGPFRTERDAVLNGQEKTNGVEGDNFIVVCRSNAFYWKRTIQEDVLLRPEGSEYNTDGIVYSKHGYEKVPGTKQGDNGLKDRVNEAEQHCEKHGPDCDGSCDEESVEELHESLNARFQKYLGE